MTKPNKALLEQVRIAEFGTRLGTRLSGGSASSLFLLPPSFGREEQVAARSRCRVALARPRSAGRFLLGSAIVPPLTLARPAEFGRIPGPPARRQQPDRCGWISAGGEASRLASWHESARRWCPRRTRTRSRETGSAGALVYRTERVVGPCCGCAASLTNQRQQRTLWRPPRRSAPGS